MALLYRAILKPTKMELISGWLPNQPWFKETEPFDLTSVGSFRFDDPDGKVGIETIIVAGENAIYQVPLTYREAPLEGAEALLITTMDHSVLGRRWVYDAVGDPVYVAELAKALLAGYPQVKQAVEENGKLVPLPESVHLVHTGTTEASIPDITQLEIDTVEGVTSIHTGELKLSINRVLEPVTSPTAQGFLTATWDGQDTPVLVAVAP
ncbi:CG0192-related protein [Neomicrococcus aestuarii]|uniref:Maltokinase N-terminal cap domain-containing protein n=1 Tax=Neomicrococcus aestuarii TaxID=556325 RepID=A0A1L2ZP93_9MICC|nr:hypothetical protein [Neomicrococcus aestuarii]APF40838.1 hypothetical protein BHE16_07215 [Neomicrococcus aestuarii]